MTYVLRMMRMRQFSSVSEYIDSAFVTGTLTTIATGGALIGIGRHEGESGRVFRLAGRALLEWIGLSSTSAPLTSVTLGYLHHLAVATLWGVFLGLVVLPCRRLMAVLAAIIASVVYVALVTTILPAPLRIGYGVTGTVSTVVPIAAALFIALLSGVWLAGSNTGN